MIKGGSSTQVTEEDRENSDSEEELTLKEEETNK